VIPSELGPSIEQLTESAYVPSGNQFGPRSRAARHGAVDVVVRSAITPRWGDSPRRLSHHEQCDHKSRWDVVRLL